MTRRVVLCGAARSARRAGRPVSFDRSPGGAEKRSRKRNGLGVMRSPFSASRQARRQARVAGLAAVHVEVEVLLLELLVRTVLDDVGNRLVDLRLQIGVFLAHADACAVAEDLRIVEVLADEVEARAARRLQEADVS